MMRDVELEEKYDDLNTVEETLMDICESVESLEYTEDRDSVICYLKDAIDSIQKAMKECDKDRWINERGDE